MPRNKTLSLAKSLAASAVVAIASLGGALTTLAHATPIIYTLDINGCSSGCGTGPYGTVTIDQNGSGLDVSVVLNAGYAFRHANDLNHHAFVFNLAGSPAVTLSNFSSNAFSGGFANPAVNDSPFGSFSYAINCATNGGATCAVGYNALNPTTLSFLLSPNSGSLNPNSFILSTGGSTNVLFAADVVTNGQCTGCTSGSTGNVGAIGPNPRLPPQSVPEPVSLALLATGLIGIGFSRRNKA